MKNADKICFEAAHEAADSPESAIPDINKRAKAKIRESVGEKVSYVRRFEDQQDMIADKFGGQLGPDAKKG
jgi:hypothetical protein